RCVSKGFGRTRAAAELRRRMVPAEYWEEALSGLPDSGERLDALIWQKLSGKKPDAREKKRVSDALARRGYGWEEISSALRRYEETADCSEEED
ncbi:MAG: RecX family transcriptional regulator, partial [Oscillospiraceae bacterium]|nr:RecX family transcriptional regulator [Oscillospiraceae bacterium]